jgi:perosamine synthetase
LHEPYIGNNELRFVKKAVNEKELSTYGKYIKIFENELRKITKAKYVTAVINCTEGLFLSLKILGIKKDQEVLVPALTFVGTVNAISYIGAHPHFVDSQIQDFGINTIKLSDYLKKNTNFKNGKCINKKTGRIISAIIPVHVFGNPCDIINIKKISKKYNFKIIEDAAEGLGSYFNKRHLGTFGDLGCISFNGNKIITTGGGGAIITNNKKLYKKILHYSTTAKIKHKWEFDHSDVGYNLRLPSLNASLGIPQLRRLQKYVKAKRSLNKIYKNMLKNQKVMKLFEEKKNCKSNYWLQAVILEKNFVKYKNSLLKVSHKRKFFLRPVWKLVSNLQPYKKKPKMNLSGAKEIYKSVFTLPSSQSLILKK